MGTKEEIGYWYRQIALRKDMLYGKYYSVQYRNKRFHRISMIDAFKINTSIEEILKYIEKLKER